MSFSVKNLSFSYFSETTWKHQVLQEITAELQERELGILLGKNGSGKTTFLYLLDGLLRPDAGNIEVLRTNLLKRKKRLRDIQQKVGFCLQFPEFQFLETTVFLEVSYTLRNSPFQTLTREEISRKAHDILLEVGFDPSVMWNRNPFFLSLGEMRLVSLAGILINKPEFLLLDEPLSGLDAQEKRAILSLLLRLKEKGFSILMAAHEAEELFPFADKVFALEDGKLIFSGKPVEFSLRPELFQRCGLPFPWLLQLTRSLNKKGYPIPPVQTMDELVRQLAERRRRKN